jgi:hypothetical protein
VLSFFSYRVLSVAKTKKMPARSKKGIIEISPIMIVSNTDEDVGGPEDELARKLRFPLMQRTYVEPW